MPDRTPTRPPTEAQLRLLRRLHEKGPQPASSLAMHSRKALLKRGFIEFIDNDQDSLEPLVGLTAWIGAPWCEGYAAGGGWS